MAGKPQEVTARQVIDLLIAIVPVAVILGIQYRDELKRAQMRVENFIRPKTDHLAEALRQTQREISLMEHGEFGGADAD